MKGRRDPVVLLDTSWRGLIPLLNLIIEHLDHAGDTLVVAVETLKQVQELFLRFNSTPAGSTAARPLILEIQAGIDVVLEMVSALNCRRGKRYYSCDRFSPQYHRGGHLYESRIHLEWILESNPCDNAMLHFAKDPTKNTLSDIKDAVLRIQDRLWRAITKMKVVSWYVTAFEHTVASGPKNFSVACEQGYEVVEGTEEIIAILTELCEFLKSQPEPVRNAFGFLLPEIKTTDPGSISKQIQVPSERMSVVMGEAGETKRQLQVHSGAEIIIANLQPSFQTTAVDLLGSPDQINRAENLINHVLTKADAGILRHAIIPPMKSMNKMCEYSNARVQDIIGDFEETLRHLHVQSGAQIEVISEPSSQKSQVYISGNPEQISRAEQLISVVLVQASLGITRKFIRPSPCAKFFQTQLSNDKAVLVIGDDEKGIQSLEAQSGANIQIVPLCVGPGFSTERTLYIDGTVEQIERAKQLIKEVTSEERPYPQAWDTVEWFQEEQPAD